MENKNGINELIKQISDIVREKDINMFDLCVSDGERTEGVTFKRNNPCQDSYSITKLYCVTALGMLFDDGLLTPSSTVASIFHDELISYGVTDGRWDNVTLDDLLRHTAGYDTDPLDIDTNDASRLDPDFLRVALTTELKYSPGSTRNYTDTAYYLASRIVTKLSGERLDDLLLRRLFNLQSVREVAFSKCPMGYPIGATGLYIRTEDMLKLGQLYLDGGVCNGKRVISEKWIGLVLDRGYELRPFGKGYSKAGMRGQRLYVNFDENIAVAWHSCESNDKMALVNDLL